MTDIIFARAGNILHILTDDGLLCDCRDWKIVDRATYRDDLLCGTCLDSWQSSAVNPQFDPVPADKVAELRDMGYGEYLKTHHWRVVRQAALDHYGRACLLCGETGLVDVHHRTYDTRGRERLHDLSVLCRDCHSRFHTDAA